MFVLVNGAFGVGKTTVARELRRRVPQSVIVDPEWIGVALQRIPGRRVSDFQDLPAWRRLTVLGARSVARLRSTVIVPMAFSDVGHLNEVRSGLAQSGRPVLHVCLVAPLDVVRDRLTARGEPRSDPRWAWVHRRAEECCVAHQSAAFATHIPTAGRAPAEIAGQIAASLGTER